MIIYPYRGQCRVCENYFLIRTVGWLIQRLRNYLLHNPSLTNRCQRPGSICYNSCSLTLTCMVWNPIKMVFMLGSCRHLFYSAKLLTNWQHEHYHRCTLYVFLKKSICWTSEIKLVKCTQAQAAKERVKLNMRSARTLTQLRDEENVRISIMYHLVQKDLETNSHSHLILSKIYLYTHAYLDSNIFIKKIIS